MSTDTITDLRNQIVTADWMRGRPLWEIKEDAKLSGLGGEARRHDAAARVDGVWHWPHIQVTGKYVLDLAIGECHAE